MSHSLAVDPINTIDIKQLCARSPKTSSTASKNLRIQHKISIPSSEANHLWQESSMSMTREQSPKHKIPIAIRFRSIEEQQLKNTQFLTLELRNNIKTTQGPRFPKSKRPEHFLKGLGEAGPSPASYSVDMSISNCTAQSEYHHQNPQKEGDTRMKWSIKGHSFSLFNNHHKTYVDHSKHQFYQPENTSFQPGPGQYNHSWVTKTKKQSYSLRPPLKRFNEVYNMNPGPGAYGSGESELVASKNSKRTICLSERAYLTKFEAFPSPNKYRITRFLEK